MRRTLATTLAFCCILAIASGALLAQDEPSPARRKVVSKLEPAYPPIARTMNLRGSVKVEAVVGANGKVKSVAVKGGHPLLAQAAENAVQHWRWEPAAHESKEVVDVAFDPN
jgi:TonB family protein